MILAHRDELIGQAIDKIAWAVGIAADKEKAESYASSSASVVVGSVQTLSRRYTRFPADHFPTLIVDEAHHILSDSYQKVLRYYRNAKVLGVTASPDHGDARDLGQDFEEIAHEVSLIELIEAGYLASIKVRTVPLEIDISRVSTRARDFSDEELCEVLDPLLDEIGQAILQYAADRKSFLGHPNPFGVAMTKRQAGRWIQARKAELEAQYA